MRDLKNKLTSGKNTKNTQSRRGKSFGYQVLGFGAGGASIPFPVATGGTIVDNGDYRTHIFTGSDTFAVTNVAPGPSGNPNVSDYLVVAGGGGGGGASYAGGAGAGGFRISNHPGSGIAAPVMSPLVTATGVTLSVQNYTVTVGSGGAATGAPTIQPGQDSSALGITSTGGGGSGANGSGQNGGSGGSGGSGRGSGAGNTPPVSPPQGQAGGNSPTGINAQGGGGGAAAAGGDGGPSSSTPGVGGIGSFIADSFINPTAPSYGTPGPVGSTRYFAGGGGGGVCAPSSTGGTGGAGGGANGQKNSGPFGVAQNGTVNTGGGGSGSGGGTGGSGIVIIRYKFQN